MTSIVEVTVSDNSGSFGANGYVTLNFPSASDMLAGAVYSCNWYVNSLLVSSQPENTRAVTVMSQPVKRAEH